LRFSEIMDSKPHSSFYSTFSGSVQRSLVRALTIAYSDACQDHHPDSGGDEQLYGLSVYKYSIHRIAEVAELSPAVFTSVVMRPEFRVVAGQYEFCCHRVGRTAGEDILRSFPNNDGAAAKMIQIPYLPGCEPVIAELRKLVLAHMGNVEDGLQAVYLCFPVREENGRIVEWGYAEEIYRAEGPVVSPKT
jgi:hypothetical protein